MVHQSVRHPLDRRIDPAPALHQGKACLSQTPVALVGMSEQAPGGMATLVPQQPVEPKIVMVNAEHGLVLP